MATQTAPNHRTPARPAAAPTPAPTPATPADGALLDQALDATIEKLDTLRARYTEDLSNPALGKLRKAIMTGAMIQRMKAMITPAVMEILRSLMNSDNGFLTDRGKPRDKEKTPYDDDTIKTCAVEALLRGVMWDGNEFNIIAGRCYVTQNGYRRKLKETPGFSDLRLSYSAPFRQGDHTVVKFAASWKLNGIADQLQDGKGEPGRLIVVTVNQGSTADQLLGKAIRKGLKAVFEQVHGSEHSDDDFEDGAQAPFGASAPKAGANSPAPSPPPHAPPAAPEPEPASADILDEIDAHFTRIGIDGEQRGEIERRYIVAGRVTQSAARDLLRELAAMPDRE